MYLSEIIVACSVIPLKYNMFLKPWLYSTYLNNINLQFIDTAQIFK